MTEQTISTLVTRLLRAIDDDDAPDYRALLSALSSNPAALRTLADDLSLCATLLPELRKLRPLGLWVRDEIDRALAAKRNLVLDGGICQIMAQVPTPAPVGRECWLEVPAHEAESRLAGLGAGWGLLVSGDVSDGLLASLRRAAPLRALGVVLTAPLSAVPTVRLDLVLRLDAPRDASAGSAVPGARVLWAGVAPEAHAALAASGQNVGLVCDAEQALAWALRLAMTRALRA